jgi:hypothetical protein
MRNVHQARQVFLPAHLIRSNHLEIPVFLPTLPIPPNRRRATPLDGSIISATDVIGTRNSTHRAAPTMVTMMVARAVAWRMTIAAIVQAQA